MRVQVGFTVVYCLKELSSLFFILSFSGIFVPYLPHVAFAFGPRVARPAPCSSFLPALNFLVHFGCECLRFLELSGAEFFCRNFSHVSTDIVPLRC